MNSRQTPRAALSRSSRRLRVAIDIIRANNPHLARWQVNRMAIGIVTRINLADSRRSRLSLADVGRAA